MKNWLLVLTLFVCSVTQKVAHVTSNVRHWDNPPTITADMFREIVERTHFDGEISKDVK